MTLIHICWIDYGDLQISGGGNFGRLEFKQQDGQWGTVCNQGFDDNAAGVACKQLGYGYGYASRHSISS